MNMQPRVPSVPLGEIAEIDREGVAPELIPAGTKYLGLEHIESGGRILAVATVDEGELASTKFRFGPKHLLFGKLRPYLAKIALPDFEGVCSTDILPVLPGGKLDRRYLAHFLRQPTMVDFAASRSTGANLPRLSPKSLAEFAVPLPPLAEQKRIAAILDQADALRRLRRRALDHLNTLGQAIFQEMFGTLDQGSGRWPQADLAEVLVDVTNGLTRRARPGEQGKQIVLRLKDIRDGYIDFDHPSRMSLTAKEEAKYRVAPGDLLFIRVNGNPEYVGRNAVFERHLEDAYFNDHVMRVRLNTARIEPTFLSHILNSAFGKSQIAVNRKTSAGQHTINQTGLGAIHVPLPPVQLQARFADRLRKASKKAEQFNLSAAQLDRLFSSLQHRAFTGQL